MIYFKTLEGMFSSTFEDKGEVDDKGNKIVATEKGMTQEEYVKWKTNQVKEKVEKLKGGSQ